MPTICIQCTMRALVVGDKPPIFAEEPEEHARQHHADLEEAKAERIKLEKRLAYMINKGMI